jgi:hypothetical protein
MTSTVALSRDAASPLVSTRALLTAGVVAGPVFLGTVVVQALAHDDFHLRVHPLSSLALGDHGWVQVTNFLVSGVLLMAFALGLRRRLHPGQAGTWGPVLVAVNGLSLIVAGLFLADPINGYPAGAVEEVTAHGIVHAAAPAVGGLAGYATFLVFARRFAAQGRRRRAAVSVALLPADLVLAGVSMAVGDFRYMLVGLALTFAWMAFLAADLLGDDV